MQQLDKSRLGIKFPTLGEKSNKLKVSQTEDKLTVNGTLYDGDYPPVCEFYDYKVIDVHWEMTCEGSVLSTKIVGHHHGKEYVLE